MLDPLSAVVTVGMILYAQIKRRREVLYAFFLALLFTLILNYLAGFGSVDTKGMIIGAMGIFYPILLLLLPLFFFYSKSIPLISGTLIGMGIGTFVRNRTKEIEIEYGEVKRKIFHILAGVFIFFMAYFFGVKEGIYAIFISALLALFLPRLKLPVIGEHIKEMYEVRGERPAEGAFNFALGSLIPVIIGQPWIVLVLGVADGIATLVGKFFGKIPLYKKKSFEGTLAGFLATLTIAKFFYPNPIIPALLYAIAELFSPIDDNLVIPILLSLLYLKPLT